MNKLADHAERLGYEISSATAANFDETVAASDVRHGAIDLCGMGYFNHAASVHGHDNPASFIAPAQELYRALDRAVELAAERYEELVDLRARLGDFIEEAKNESAN